MELGMVIVNGKERDRNRKEKMRIRNRNRKWNYISKIKEIAIKK